MEKSLTKREEKNKMLTQITLEMGGFYTKQYRYFSKIGSFLES